MSGNIDPGIFASSGAKKASIYGQVTRANGRVEPNRLLAFRHRNPLIHHPVNWFITVRDWCLVARNKVLD